MGLLGIVVVQPLLHELPHIGQRAEQVGTEQLPAKRAVKASEVGILGRLAGLDSVQSNVLLLTSLTQPGAAKLWSIISPWLRELAMLVD